MSSASCAASYSKNHDSFGKPRLAIAERGRIPDPEPVRPVSTKFLHLAGDHQPHPGTGKGRRYVNGALAGLAVLEQDVRWQLLH